MKDELQLRGAADPGRGLVAQNEGEQHLTVGKITRLSDRERGGRELDAGVATTGVEVALILLQPGARHPVAQRGLQGLGTQARAEYGRGTRW